MSEHYDVEIKHLDGSVETIQYVTHQQISGGVLFLYRETSITYRREHLGSWPLANISKWTRHDR